MTQTKVGSFGECMMEFNHVADASFRLQFGGDSYNMATYLSRVGKPLDITVSYLTALGEDPYSARMLKTWQDDGLDTALVQRIKGKLPGLYLIDLDARGERTFYFYRKDSAARDVLKSPEAAAALLDRLGDFHYFYFSGISLSILDEDSRDKLHGGIARARGNGTRIVFDTNYRPSGWTGVEAARTTMNRFLPLVDIALPTLSDEQILFGDVDADACATRLLGHGIGEVIIKRGDEACLVATPAARAFVAAEKNITPKDTTAAGDSFNAAYLAGRITGLPPHEAAEWGHRLASMVIQHPGAIIPISAMPRFTDTPKQRIKTA